MDFEVSFEAHYTLQKHKSLYKKPEKEMEKEKRTKTETFFHLYLSIGSHMDKSYIGRVECEKCARRITTLCLSCALSSMRM